MLCLFEHYTYFTVCHVVLYHSDQPGWPLASTRRGPPAGFSASSQVLTGPIGPPRPASRTEPREPERFTGAFIRTRVCRPLLFVGVCKGLEAQRQTAYGLPPPAVHHRPPPSNPIRPVTRPSTFNSVTTAAPDSRFGVKRVRNWSHSRVLFSHPCTPASANHLLDIC